MALLMTMEKQSDRELLELAALAAGVDLDWIAGATKMKNRGKCWNPLTDDGDALRLAAKLKLNIEYDAPNYVTAWNHEDADYTHMVAINDDLIGATRKSIVRAAAEIGRRMQDEQSTAARGFHANSSPA
jgi:hypothetical protein